MGTTHLMFRAIGFTTDCFGITIGTLQTANLGDGQGWVNQIAVMRADYGEPDEGSCLESLTGSYNRNGSLGSDN
jgi:hypothetical protein